ncbi:MAG: hypothetical protein ACREJC_12255, partial [Tepidisphaeraceae bacterium]
VWMFYVLFAVGMFGTAMEEIAWGQKLLRFPTPQYWSQINAQHEVTLHNLTPIQGHTEYFRLTFCVGAIVGLLAGRSARFALVSVSPLLWSWLILMTGITAIDTVNDYQKLGGNLDAYISRFSEVIELMIAMVGCLYVRLNAEAYSRLREHGQQRLKVDVTPRRDSGVIPPQPAN